MKELIRKIKLKSSNLPRKITLNEVDIFDELQLSLTLSLRTSGVNWQVKFQMLLQLSNPT